MREKMTQAQKERLRLERRQTRALKVLFKTSMELGEKTTVRIRGEVLRSFRQKDVKRGRF